MLNAALHQQRQVPSDESAPNWRSAHRSLDADADYVAPTASTQWVLPTALRIVIRLRGKLLAKSIGYAMPQTKPRNATDRQVSAANRLSTACFGHQTL
jgi:hypothetical protein